MSVSTIEALNIDQLSVEKHHAFDILRNLPIEKLIQLKKLMNLGEPEVIGSETLEKFLQLCKNLHLDLSDAGVNEFKDNHGLGNAPPWKGIIGRQTAEVYWNEIISHIPELDIRKVDHPNGAWIWNLSELRNNYLDKLAECKVKRVYLKVFDGKSQPMFWSYQCSPQVIEQFKFRGIQVYGWGFHYGTSDVAAQVSAVKQALDCGIDGYILDLETEVEDRSTHPNVERLLSALRPLVKEGTLGYTSFGHPGFHPNVPWKILDQYCDIALPQIYFEQFSFKSTNEEEVQDCLEAHKQIGLTKPILPIWGSESGVRQPASAKELQSYLNRFPGSSIFRLPDDGEDGEAWNLKYSGQPIVILGGSQPSDFELPTLTRYLRKGSIGEDVKALQRVLNAHAFNAGAEDGEFGSDTEAAVRAFQMKAGITVDGEIGSQTWKALGGKVSSAALRDDQGIRLKLANFAEDEAAKNLKWNRPDSDAEKYLKIFREPMFKLDQIGKEPVFYNWCAAFVTYCCRNVGIEIPDVPEGFWATMALVDSWQYWAQKKGFWYPKRSIVPRRGDILLFDWPEFRPPLDHIGIVRGYTPGSSIIQTAEGNSGPNSISRNTDREISLVAGVIRIS